jgi:AraC family transcriptional regulator
MTIGACRTTTAEARIRAVRRVIAVMRERYAESLSLDELSGIAISSPFHFNRVFREVTGLPPGQFLAAIRLQVAKQLLLKTRRKVTNICFDVGYSSLGTFSAHFAQYVGAPPSRFRQLVRTGPGRLPPGPPAIAAIAVAGGSRVRGHVRATEGDGATGVAMIGLFATRLPRGRPRACVVAEIGSDFVMENVAPGSYHLFAMAMSTSTDDVAMCLGESVRLGHCGPIHVGAGCDAGPLDVEMRWPRDTDPPLLIALPVLMSERG